MQQDRIEPEEDSTAAKDLAGLSQVVESSSTSLMIASTSAADNIRPLSPAQSRNIVTAILTTPTSSEMNLQDMNINVPNVSKSSVFRKKTKRFTCELCICNRLYFVTNWYAILSSTRVSFYPPSEDKTVFVEVFRNAEKFYYFCIQLIDLYYSN
ncbi:hypothetical protein WA026_020948 [Henosepilachna vigintioctopunctata]|uniref:Uncharacterized protein n=1 Tax=Henosepilachna vigintioctopunctata TaxID=420089 RepID=A0AAW1VBJ3_9CUCU